MVVNKSREWSCCFKHKTFLIELYTVQLKTCKIEDKKSLRETTIL